MIKIKALNQESSSDEDVPTIRRDAQEEIVLELYNNALRAEASAQYEQAGATLKQLIEENIPELENNGGLPKSMSTLKYSCFVNLGNICLNQKNINIALEYLSKASELDDTDVTLWAKIGKLSLKEGKFNKAVYAFSKGLECNENHWPSLDNLISVLYAIGDTVSCLVYIGKALILDNEYIKGVILKNQIYKENPATKEYYRLFNPDHIYEPNTEDTLIDAEDEEEILNEANLLRGRVTEAEKAQSLKPLNEIPLAKTLEEYSWLSLAKTIIYNHQYLTKNNMGHLTIFDMSQCMSQTGENSNSITKKILEETPLILDKVKVSESQEVIADNNTIVQENQESEAKVLERRFSQNSDNTGGNETLDNTPNQTDNDEEQNMEIDNDNETDGDNADTSQQKKKGVKRKRDVLSELQIWGWHSKRKPPKKFTRDFTVEDALNRIIPNSLLRNKITKNLMPQADEDSMDTMDMYNMYVESKELKFLSPIHSPESSSSELYFNTEREKEDVLNFWTKERIQVDIMVLVKEFVFALSKLWNYKWPVELVPLYIQIFKMFREYCDQPQPLCGEETVEEIQRDAFATLLYCEFITFSSETNNEAIHPFTLWYLQIISGWSEEWANDFSIRFYWVHAHNLRKNNENELAINAFQLILERLSTKENQNFHLKNCFKHPYLSKEIIEKIIEHLNMVSSLESVKNFFELEKYEEVAEILKQTFHMGGGPRVGHMGRQAQLGILMHSLWFTNTVECFIWCEECLHESTINFIKPNSEIDKWSLVIEKCLGMLQEIIKKETILVTDKLSKDNRSRLVENLCKIVCKQLNSKNASNIPLGTISPWIILHYLLLREEQRQYAIKRASQSKRCIINSDDGELPPSLTILFSAHEFLGPKSWCLTGGGELLHFILDTVVDNLECPIYEPLRDKIDIHVEQAMFCLYLYPSKKNKISRHLVDHNVDPIPLSWERSIQLYQYYAPDSIPEFNSYKSQSISSDLEQLFQRIIVLVPSVNSVQNHLPNLKDFIQGKSMELLEPLEFPYKIRAIYYLLGDYYFKEKEFSRCIKYYQSDVCINPLRLDSWAALGLSYAAQLENSLNYCENLNSETEFFEKAKCAQICFRKAVELDPENLVLWIECGSFEYLVHSFCSRLIKYESENFSMEKFGILETEKESYLDSSGTSLEQAIKLSEIEDSNEPDERWLQYYILGKIAEKKRKEPLEYLQHYMMASNLLHENEAAYPDKISYNNPQHLSVEALELHYRIHASILKYLELHEGKEISNTLGNFFKKCLSSTAKRYTTAAQLIHNPIVIEEQNKAAIEEAAGDNVEFIVKSCLEDILNKVEHEIIKLENLNPDVAIIETTVDIIMISDSDDEEEASKVTIQESKEEIKVETIPKEAEIISAKENVEVAIKKLHDDDDSSSSSSISSSGSDSDSDSSSSSSTSSSESTNENLSLAETVLLIEKCIQGLEICITRLPQNYKALYRLAHLFFNYKSLKDYVKSKHLLLGQYKCKNELTVNGLFSERNTKNFFHGIWRIPSTEIDRPGSLAAHMNRCISLVLQVSRDTNDTKTLIEFCLQLKKAPEKDKIYIKDSDRVSYSNQAMEMCVQSFKGQIKNIATMRKPQIMKLLHDIYRVYQRIQKFLPNKESVFSSLLAEAYKSYMKDTIMENANILDLAVKFCQQHRPMEKPKVQPTTVVQISTPNPTSSNFTNSSRIGTIPQNPILPTPTPPPPSSSSSSLSISQKLMKPPGLGRPRGRPPLSKAPGQFRQPRTKNLPSSSWPNSMFNYEYLKHYQEELIKQYSQNLSLNQLKQLTSYFSPGGQQLNSSPTSVAAQAATNQFLAQNNALFNSTNFLGTMLKPEQLKYMEAFSSNKNFNISPSSFASATNKPRINKSSSSKIAAAGEFVMKDRPNISITPVANVNMTSLAGNSSKISTSSAARTTTVISSATHMNSSPKTYPSSASSTSTSSVKSIKALSTKASAFTISSITSTPSPPSANYSKPFSVPTSPGKTLQQKLAEKKKEQETKQQIMMNKNETIIKVSTITNIPASLTVTPSTPNITQRIPFKYPSAMMEQSSKIASVSPNNSFTQQQFFSAPSTFNSSGSSSNKSQKIQLASNKSRSSTTKQRLKLKKIDSKAPFAPNAVLSILKKFKSVDITPISAKKKDEDVIVLD